VGIDPVNRDDVVPGAAQPPVGDPRAVFLDRDGVINGMWWDPDHGTVDSPANPDQFRLLPGVPEAIRELRALGFRIVVVSNQPGIGKGKMAPHLLDAITQKMRAELAGGGARLDAVYYCLHHPEAARSEYRQECPCRKPRPGLLRRAADDLAIDLARSYMVGDGVVDIQAGRAVRCTTIWLGTVKCETCQVMRQLDASPHYVAASLAEAAKLIAEMETCHADLR
jgi:D-glycero-D-manno-heptose 1,7-bisphosphate phosphatase